MKQDIEEVRGAILSLADALTVYQELRKVVDETEVEIAKKGVRVGQDVDGLRVEGYERIVGVIKHQQQSM